MFLLTACDRAPVISDAQVTSMTKHCAESGMIVKVFNGAGYSTIECVSK